jgi:mycothiol synthase
MIFSLPPPMRLAAHTWRPLRPEDAAALHQLELDCAPMDGGTSIASIAERKAKLEEAGDNLTTDTLCAVDSTGHLAAAAWVTCDDYSAHEYRTFLDGRVHPDYRGRGLGSFILQWMETRARQMLSALKQDRPAVLRFDFYDRSDDALALFEQHGFRFSLAEDEWRRDLQQPVPVTELPQGMAVVTWSPQRATQFFDVYQDAFRERPRFPNWSEDTWRLNFTGGAGFRPDLSLLLLQGPEPVGFALCHVEAEGAEDPASVGWIVQMGVRPAWRKRGLGTTLLHEEMRRFQAEGLSWAALEVNIDNYRALRLYQRLGFERRRRRTVYKKTVS